jgi:Domain of unknown function (DUF4124)
MRAILFTLLSVVSVAALSATVYKWVDEDGVTHYSDQPHENAEKVQLTEPQTYSAPRTSSRARTTSADKPAANAYSSCDVVQPTNDQTFPDVTSVTASVQVSPPPQSGDQVFLLLDGARVPNFPTGGGSVTINPIDRGTHSLQAVVQDSNGKVLCQSPNVSFTVLQPSVLNPANPNFHH